MASDMGVRFLGCIELDPQLGQACDSGRSFITEYPHSKVSIAYKEIMKSKLVNTLYGISNNFLYFQKSSVLFPLMMSRVAEVHYSVT